MSLNGQNLIHKIALSAKSDYFNRPCKGTFKNFRKIAPIIFRRSMNSKPWSRKIFKKKNCFERKFFFSAAFFLQNFFVTKSKSSFFISKNEKKIQSVIKKKSPPVSSSRSDPRSPSPLEFAILKQQHRLESHTQKCVNHRGQICVKMRTECSGQIQFWALKAFSRAGKIQFIGEFQWDF